MSPIVYFSVLLLKVLLISVENGLPDRLDSSQKGTRVKYYWNIPTFQCDYHKLNFSGLAEKYNIIQNENDRFRGNEVVILYDPGSFPALLKSDTKLIRRNGGVPQEGNLTLHLSLFQELVDELIDENFAGVGVIDFESWRPIFRQNFGTLAPYKALSIDIERENHPFWPSFLLQKEAIRRFELWGRRFMEETLVLAKKIRQKATWGYYAYPYCFNMAPKNMQMACPTEVQKENDKSLWLFKLSDNFYPSIYLSKYLSSSQKMDMIQGRINEAHRLATFAKTDNRTARILPYFWFKYHGGDSFLTKEDLANSFSTLAKSQVDGVIIWGSSNDVNTKKKCLDLYDYVDNVLGPSLVNHL